MAINLKNPLPNFQGVVAGGTATARLTLGLRFHAILIPYSGMTLAQMTEIRLFVNGQVLQRITGGDVLDAMNQFDGMNAANGILTLNLDRFGLRTRPGSDFTVLDTTEKAIGDPNAITSARIEIDIAAGATAPVLGVPKAKQSGAVASPSNVVKHIRTFGYDPAGSGEFQIADLPKFGAIGRIFMKSAVTINSMKLVRNNYPVLDLTKAENEVFQKDGVRVPQAGYTVIDFSEEGNGQDWLEVAGVQELRLSLDMAGAGHVDLLVEYLADIKS